MKFQQPVNRGKVLTLLAQLDFGFDLADVGKNSGENLFSQAFYPTSA